MTNTKIKDMIETIEQFAQSQPDFPVYNILGEVHTYGDLKADSDSLAAKIDSLDIPEKSPVVVYGGQEYEMLATFVALTKSHQELQVSLKGSKFHTIISLVSPTG